MSVFTEFAKNYDYEGESWKIVGREPAGTSKELPVFLWFMGTGDQVAAPVDITRIEAMAARGFIAGAVDYPNDLEELVCSLTFASWEDTVKAWKDKARKIVRAALDAMCAHARADCGAGVAISGHSQGGFITQLGLQSVAGRVTAIHPLGIGCVEGDLGDSELEDSEVSQYLAKEQRLIVTGEADDLYDEQCLKKMSGYSSAATSIGPGYMMVPLGAHGYYGEHAWSISNSKMKCAYRNGNEPWALDNVSDWLAKAASTKHVEVRGSDVEYSHECVDSAVSDSPAGEDMPLAGCILGMILGIGFAVLCCCCCWCGGICYCYKKKTCCFKGGQRSPQ